MSLINFLNAKLKPSVDCPTITEIGYEASNLISEDAERLQRGFMGFAPTKPPAEIVFFFPKAVDLKVLKLWNSQGGLRSTAFEVHSMYEGNWERIGYVRELEKGVDTVTFCYQSECSRSNANNKGNDAMQQEGNVFSYFFKSAHKMLANTNSIKVTIRATHKCVPVMRKAQVWGLPSRKLEKADRELVLTIWREIVNPFGEKHNQQQQLQQSGQRSPSRSVPELAVNSKLKIPEEFLDAITWEIMIFPTILPSGKVVDQSTIDRHSEVEALWGRMPSDPFTGLEFTQQRKAILDAGLKMRIEKFLMENSEQFKTIPRALGSRVRRSKNRHASQFANAVCQGPNNLPAAGTYSTLSNNNNNGKARKRSPPATITRSLSNVTIPAAKHLKLNDTTTTTIAATTATTTTYRSEIPLLTSAKQSLLFTPATASATLTSLSTAAVTTSPSSIDNAIQRALQQITCYTRPAETKSPRCINCKSEDFVYKIQTCCHLVCRDCLVQLSNDHMCACKTSFRGADVERYHKL